MASRMFVYLTTPQTISKETLTKVQFDTVGFDKNSEWDAVNYRWVCKEAGIYAAHAFLLMNMGAHEENLQARIHLNDMSAYDQVALGFGHQSSGACAWPKCTALLELAVGDYLEVWTREDGASAQDLTCSVPVSHNGFCVWRVA